MEQFKKLLSELGPTQLSALLKIPLNTTKKWSNQRLPKVWIQTLIIKAIKALK